MSETPPRSGAAPELVEAGFAVEVGDAPLLHEGLNLADALIGAHSHLPNGE